MPDRKPSRLAHVDIPRGADPASRSPTAPEGAGLLREPRGQYAAQAATATTCFERLAPDRLLQKS
jgi:hypothetical protein